MRGDTQNRRELGRRPTFDRCVPQDDPPPGRQAIERGPHQLIGRAPQGVFVSAPDRRQIRDVGLRLDAGPIPTPPVGQMPHGDDQVGTQMVPRTAARTHGGENLSKGLRNESVLLVGLGDPAGRDTTKRSSVPMVEQVACVEVSPAQGGE
nr:hypothetical protein [Amycolatopsis sp. NBRC 101858]